MKLKKFLIRLLFISMFVSFNVGFSQSSDDFERIKKVALEISRVYDKYASIVDGTTVPVRMKEIVKIVDESITPDFRGLRGWTPIADSLVNFTKIWMNSAWALQQLPKAELNVEIQFLLSDLIVSKRNSLFHDRTNELLQKMVRKYESWPSHRFLFWALQNMAGLSATEWNDLSGKNIEKALNCIREQTIYLRDLEFIFKRVDEVKKPTSFGLPVFKEFKRISDNILDFLKIHKKILEKSETLLRLNKIAPSLPGLNYWIEKKEDRNYAYVWIKVPEIPANSEKKIYLYYGNPNADSKSSIQDTFIIGDDWNDGDYKNNPTWSVESGNFSVKSGVLTQTRPDGNIYIPQTRFYNTCWEWKWRVTGHGETRIAFASDGHSFPYHYDHGYFVGIDGRNQGTNRTFALGRMNRPGQTTNLISGPWIADTKWHTVKIIRNQKGWELVFDGVSQGYSKDITYKSTNYVNMQFEDVTEIDDFRVRKYIETEPSTITGGEKKSNISGYSYMREIIINNTKNPISLSDYQIFAKILYSGGMQDDFDDIRFFTSDMENR